MPDTTPALDASTSPAPDLHKVGIHHDFIKTHAASVPTHLVTHLNSLTFNLPEWFTKATRQQRHNLKYSQHLNQQSFGAVSHYLDQISTVEAFAAPLLERGIKEKFGITCDVKKNVITITTLNWFTKEVERSTTKHFCKPRCITLPPTRPNPRASRNTHICGTTNHAVPAAHPPKG